MTKEIIHVPDLGGADEVEVIEICVAVGDMIKKDDSLLVLESDKASMEVPSPQAGKVISVLVKEGDKLQQGAAIFEIETEASASVVAATPVAEKAPIENPVKQPVVTAPEKNTQASTEAIAVPDIGTTDAVQVIEVCVKVGDVLAEGDSLLVLESDKASMEIPSPKAGKVLAIKVQEGASVKQGDAILDLQVEGVSVKQEKPPLPMPAEEARQVMTEPKQVSEKYQTITGMTENRPTGDVHAGPAVRKMAREIGLDLVMVPGSGPRGRIQKSDVKAFIKDALKNKLPTAQVTSGSGIPAIPTVDFSQFGEITIEPLTKLHKVTAANMHRSWLNVPHVTQFDEADITDLEEFRNGLKAEAEKAGVKITPLPFLLKACAAALKANPKFNASLSADGENLVYKNYVHIGIAVDTPAGLMVPVIRDVDKKSLFELAAESNELAQKAKERKLKPVEMQGGCFTISSLGGMGGTGFTPIVNAPEIGILGVSKLDIKPRWNGKEFEPRKMLPLCLSYDHRAVNGADAGKFMVFLNNAMSDIRRLVL
jgi:pyruvate dehydrogenase E2 component (dihydrolipoamide acetyltransferase)